MYLDQLQITIQIECVLPWVFSPTLHRVSQKLFSTDKQTKSNEKHNLLGRCNYQGAQKKSSRNRRRDAEVDPTFSTASRFSFPCSSCTITFRRKPGVGCQGLSFYVSPFCTALLLGHDILLFIPLYYLGSVTAALQSSGTVLLCSAVSAISVLFQKKVSALLSNLYYSTKL